MGTVLFASGSAVIDTGGRDVVQAAAQLVSGRDLRQVSVTGFTDATGNAALNAGLSASRATAVAIMLRSFVGPRVRVSTGAAASAYPAATNRTRYGKTLNRRVVITATP